MGEIVNLNKFRKRRARADAARLADQNRRKHARTKAERAAERNATETAKRRLEHKRLLSDPPADEDGQDGA